MSDANICDRPVHDGKGEALFVGPAGIVIQTPRGEFELCPACVEEFNEWWDSEEETAGETIGDQLEESG